MGQYRKFKKVAIRLFCHIILCAPLLVTANPFELGGVKKLMNKGMQGSSLTPALIQEMKLLLTDHFGEWDKVKPTLNALINSESDFTKAIEIVERMPAFTSKANENDHVVSTKQVKPEINKSVKIGIHLASYKGTKNIHRGWETLEHDFEKQLKGRVAFYYQTKVNNTQYTRLVVGDFNSQHDALTVCKTLARKGQYCQVTNYTLAVKKV